jgi:hypothetical protein
MATHTQTHTHTHTHTHIQISKKYSLYWLYTVNTLYTANTLHGADCSDFFSWGGGRLPHPRAKKPSRQPPATRSSIYGGGGILKIFVFEKSDAPTAGNLVFKK